MRIRLTSIVVAAMLLLAAARPPLAADANGLFSIKGVGTLRCDAYVKAAETGSSELPLYAGYVAGWVSSYNENQPDTFDLLPWQDMQTVMLLMLKRCQQYPSITFGATMTQFARFFDDRKLESLPERITLGDGEESLVLFAPVVDDVRVALAKRGYATEDLYASLRKFQRDQQLPAAADNIQTTLLRLLYSDID